MEFRWNEEKNKWLKENRGVCFEDVVEAIQGGKGIEVIPHTKDGYSHQKILVVNIKDYIYCVPFVLQDNFLKTIYPSRKFTKKYL